MALVERVITNKVRCKLCDTIIESVHRHDFVYCKCGNIAVDGGKEYLRRVGDVYYKNVEDLSVTEEVEVKMSWED